MFQWIVHVHRHVVDTGSYRHWAWVYEPAESLLVNAEVICSNKVTQTRGSWTNEELGTIPYISAHAELMHLVNVGVAARSAMVTAFSTPLSLRNPYFCYRLNLVARYIN